MAVKFIAPTIAAVSLLALTACMESGGADGSKFELFPQGVPAMGLASANSPALGQNYDPASHYCEPIARLHCYHIGNTPEAPMGEISHDSPALGILHGK